jgi:hypothetical protein
MKTKLCKACGVEHDLESGFYFNRKHNNYSTLCRPCTCAQVRTNRAMRSEYYAQYERMRFDQDGPRCAPTTPEVRARISREWSKKNREKRRAHCRVKRAIDSGNLLRGPCEVCGVSDGVEAHHDDYDKPLDVRWLCTVHHGETRRKPRDPGFTMVRGRRAA